MTFQGDVGRSYSRKDITSALDLPPTSDGNWAVGYPRHGDEFFIFANIGGPGRVGPDYDTYWESGLLRWTTNNRGHHHSPAVRDLISNRFPVHVFYRYSDRSAFVYAGIGTAQRTERDNPVRVWWSFVPTPKNVELRGVLAACGFQLDRPGTHAQLAHKNDLAVYIKTKTDEFPLVLPPYFEGDLKELTSIPGIVRPNNELFYHNSGMKAFPKRKNEGRSGIHFGLAFGYEDLASLPTLLDLARSLPPPTEPIIDGAGAATKRRQGQTDQGTETEARRAARLGQSGFRADLLSRYVCTCALTDVDMCEMLRASHIKPWCRSNDAERLDPDNGLLLSVHLDLLFDRGFISFEDDGRILLSPLLEPSVIKAYGLNENLRLKRAFAGNQPYLKHHRDDVFKSGRKPTS